MKIIDRLSSNELVQSLKNGGVAIVPTDTVYGIVGQINNTGAIEKIYKLKGRGKNKPFIVLISGIKDLELLGIKLDQDSKMIVKKYWPGKISIIFKRAKDTLAVRLPDHGELRSLIEKTGPLVAPSANPEGLAPAKDINGAIGYFRNSVPFYVDGGKINSLPSTLIKLKDGKIVVLRKGAVTIDESVKAP